MNRNNNRTFEEKAANSGTREWRDRNNADLPRQTMNSASAEYRARSRAEIDRNAKRRNSILNRI